MTRSRGLKKSGRTGRPVAPIGLTPSERKTLLRWARRGRDVPPLVGRRAQIILMAADEATSVAIAERLRVSAQTVCLWRGRFVARRLDGLWSARERDVAR